MEKLLKVDSIVFSNDDTNMNWLRKDYEYAQVKCPEEFRCTVSNVRDGDEIITTISIKNESRHAYFTDNGTIGIRFPLTDMYDMGSACLERRCHAHIFCGDNTSYVMALRMGGAAPHFGMVLTEGSLSGYSIERDISKMSNDRGCFILHPSSKEFAPNETMTISWKIFPHNGREDFYRKAKEFTEFVEVKSDKYILFLGETANITITVPNPEEGCVINGEKQQCSEEGLYNYVFKADKCGEYKISIKTGKINTYCRLLVQLPIDDLLNKRTNFIVENQQYHGRIGELIGAYLTYDNEEKHLVYRAENDYNAARERLGMGVLIARHLIRGRVKNREKKEKSLLTYKEYIEREIVDKNTGLVCNDTGRDNSYFRLYNYPWAATLFVEFYKLWGNETDLDIACKIIQKFYEQGGFTFYPIEMPVAAICEELKKAGKADLMGEIIKAFKKHADKLLTIGKKYPASEVNYEQSIVAPVADMLLQVYQVTGEEKYLDGAKIQMDILELFNGNQPDYHLNEVAIRHWDGYWFGKYRVYGDTCPHYWSAETGRVFRRYAAIAKDDKYSERAEKSLRAVLSMFYPDGTATCAYVFPYSVNGTRADFADPYANDQDWGLCSNIEVMYI